MDDEAEEVFGRADHRAADLAREYGVSEAMLYNWKAKYGGLDVSEAKRLKGLEDEHRKLKKLLAESMLDNAALKELLSKNGRARRQARSRHSSAQRLGDERASGLHPDCCGSNDDPLTPAARYGPAGEAARAGQ